MNIDRELTKIAQQMTQAALAKDAELMQQLKAQSQRLLQDCARKHQHTQEAAE